VRAPKAVRGSHSGENCVLAPIIEDGFADSSEEEPSCTRIRGLAHCDVLIDRCTRQRSLRLEADQNPYQSAASAHLREHGHELRFGCCSAYPLV
jgi:hypothetical protein